MPLPLAPALRGFEAGVRLAAVALLVACPLAAVAWAQATPGPAAGATVPGATAAVWRLWREDATPLEGLKAFVPPATEPGAPLALPPEAARLWPVDVPTGGRFLEFSNRPNPRFAGLWDDVYASWSGTHGWLRDRWAGDGGNEVAGITKSVLGVVDLDPVNQHERLGVNFYHQSTTGMGHALTNGTRRELTEAIERLYFSSGLVTAPCHLSLVEETAEQTTGAVDLYMAYLPTLFNSVGSSDSETMAITKMMIAGAFLRPELKLEIKRAGLYAGTMLWLWKSCLPIDAAFEEEWRHRVAYASVGDRKAFPGGYGATGLERGDMALDYHRYDDTEHLRRMVSAARALEVPPPEAAFTILDQTGGRTIYALKKAACIVQQPDETVEVVVSTEPSFDARGRPLALRWRLLHGPKTTTVEREDPGSAVYRIRVPADPSLPEGRTTLLLVADNGLTEGNPAALTVYRRKGPLPPSGHGYGDYVFDRSLGNRRPILLGLKDRAVKPGETIRLPLRAIDPEGAPTSFTKRAGDPGEIDGSQWVWTVPAKEAPGTRTVTFLASDGTSGNSYDARTVRFFVGRKSFPTITADRFHGPAPLNVRFKSDGAKGEWATAPRTPGEQVMPAAAATGASWTGTFEKPGVHEVFFRTRTGDQEDLTRVTVFVTERGLPVDEPSRLAVEGRGVYVADGDPAPCAFDGTDFGEVAADGRSFREQEFLVRNLGDRPLTLARPAIVAPADAAASFTLRRAPRTTLEPRGSAKFVLRFAPKAAGSVTATVELRAGALSHRFAVQGTGRP